MCTTPPACLITSAAGLSDRGWNDAQAKSSSAKACASDESAELLDVLDQNEVAAAIGSLSWNA